MATIAENLQTIKDSTAAIKQSIINKGGEISGNITTWASAIDGINTGGSGGEEVNTFGEVMVDKNGIGILNITKLIISDDVSIIKTSAYFQFANLTYVVLSEGITDIGNQAFYTCRSLKTINFPATLKRIGTSAFYLCGLVDVFLPDSLLDVGSHAFMSNASLKSIRLSENLTVLNMRLFYGCSSLLSISIPPKIKTIDREGFSECTSLTIVDLSRHTEVPSLVNVNAFHNTTCQFVVPDALYDEWIAATNWSTYADRIVKASEYVETN